MEVKDQEYKFILGYTASSKTNHLEKKQEQNICEIFKNLQKFILFVHFLWKVLEDVQKTINPKKQSKGKSKHHNWGINQKNNL